MTTASPVMFEQDPNQTCADLLRFIDASPTPYHAVAESAARLAAIGFAEVSLATDFASLSPGGYFVTASDGTIVAFVRPRRAVTGFRIIGAHTDSPNLRLKPRALYEKAGYLQLGVEVYGGVLLNSWLDRDLRLAGRVVVRDDDGRLKARLVTLSEPIVRVPQLAIHLDRDVHEKGLMLNRQEHMVPILGLSDAALSALLRTHSVDDDSGVASVVALFDHEEVGSSSDHGAQSALLPQVLERLVLSTGGSRESYHQALARSLCASTDMSHAVHPNYVERHEANHRPLLNGGPVIKYNSQQRYATSLPTAALMIALGQQAGIELQQYVHRTDLPCGSTIGPIVSTLLGIPTVDLGNPMLSMHSVRELCGAADPEKMSRLLAHFLVSRELVAAAR